MKGKKHIFIYPCFPLSICLTLSLPASAYICLSAIFHNQKYLLSLPSHSAGRSQSLYFYFLLLSLCLSLRLQLGLISSPLCLTTNGNKRTACFLFVFHSPLCHRTISEEHINTASPGKSSQNSFLTPAEKKRRRKSAAQYLSSFFGGTFHHRQVEPQRQESVFSLSVWQNWQSDKYRPCHFLCTVSVW